MDGDRLSDKDAIVGSPAISGLSIASAIILDMDGDGNELVPASASSAGFDMDGDGKPDDTSWFGSGDAILFLDRDGNGTVTDASEIAFVGDFENARSSLDGLKAFDTDKDGKLSSADSDFGKFGLWQDRNGDGAATAAEITTLAASGVLSLSLAGTPTNVPAAAGEAVALATGHFTRTDGTQGMLADSALSYFPSAAGTNARIDLRDRSFDRKRGKYQITAQGGQLFVAPVKAKGALDPGSGRIEAATLLNFKGKTIGMLAPIILDLDGDGVEMVARGKSKARFDMDGDGTRDDTGWAGKGDGFLVIDRDNDGLITGAAELSFLSEKPGARSDLEALAALDSNRDRKIDATDLRFGELKVWVDGNRNGITDAGELRTLQDLNIASIDLAGAATQQSVKPGQNILLATGSFTLADGTVRSLGDAALAFKPSRGAAAVRLGAGSGPGGGAPDGVRRPAEEPRQLPGPEPELTSALRSGLGDDRPSMGSSGLSFGLSPEVSPFDYFAGASPGDPGSQAVSLGGDTDSAPADSGLSSLDLRVALMVQSMAGFGRSHGEAELRDKGRDAPRFDYFA
ncbi:MAG TPA: hypothetical protein VF645_00760 [Allosphingosinicella sp.]